MDAAAIKAFFEDVASDWDTMRLDYYDERVIEQLASAPQLTGAETVVDVGTGTGFVAAGLAPHADRVLGFDNAAAMLDVARKTSRASRSATSSSPRPTSTRSRSPTTQPTRPWPTWSSTTPTTPRRMITEMARVTRPGGWIAITDEVEHPYERMRTEHADLWLGFTAHQIEGFFGDARLSHYGYAPLGTQ